MRTVAEHPQPGQAPRTGTTPTTPPRRTGAERFLRLTGAVAVVGGPVAYFVGGLLSPTVHTNGAETVAANATAPQVANAVHLAAFVVGSYLLPIGVVALAWLAWPRAPRAAAAGAMLGVVGWVPLAALTALDDLAALMGRSPTGGASGVYADLYDRFSTDVVMGAYLLVYVVAHLLAYVVLGFALRRTVPAWSAWAIVLSSPLLVVAFALPGELAAAPFLVAAASVVSLAVGSVPAAWALARGWTRGPDSGARVQR
jgi:hypothetical protein